MAKNTVKTYDDFDVNTVGSFELTTEKLAELQRTRVLLIEDDRTTRRMVMRSLGSYCEIIESFSAGCGIANFINFSPDIVFLDLELPDHDGHHVLEWIMYNDPGAYVVLFSANCDAKNVDRAMNNGAQGYVPKPFDTGSMLHHVFCCPKLH